MGRRTANLREHGGGSGGSRRHPRQQQGTEAPQLEVPQLVSASLRAPAAERPATLPADRDRQPQNPEENAHEDGVAEHGRKVAAIESEVNPRVILIYYQE